MIVASVPSSGVEAGDQVSCDAVTGVTVAPATGPSCTFDLICVEFCRWVVNLNVNGVGLVEGTMGAEVLFSSDPDASFRFVDFSLNTVDPPSCQGVFHCTPETVTFLDLPALMLLRIRCNGGGAAAVESIHCEATTVF